MVNQEVWKPIKGYEGKYELSNLYNVKSVERYVKHRTSGLILIKEKILKQYFYKGYYQVGLCLNSKKRNFGIHQLVAMEHFGHVPCGFTLVVDHINHITTDNRLENLRIVPQRINANKKHLKSSSQYTGVSWAKTKNKWISKIIINGKQIHLGQFDTEKEASEYYENSLKNHSLGLPIEIKKATFTSKYTGVYWAKNRNKWQVFIYVNDKRICLGYFNIKIEAHNIRQIALENIDKYNRNNKEFIALVKSML